MLYDINPNSPFLSNNVAQSTSRPHADDVVGSISTASVG